MTARVQRIESHHRVADGLRLFRRAWLPTAPHHAVVLVHGFGEHSGRYDETGVALAEAGYAVESFDLRGHGRSDGARCHVQSFDEYLDDLDHVLDWTRDATAGLPIHLLGHSMGGLITITHLVERPVRVVSAVVTGPPLATEGQPAWKVWLGRLGQRIVPTLSMPMGLPQDGLSRDPEVVRRYAEDPLVEANVTAGLGGAMVDAIARTAACPGRVSVPLLALHGGADPICSAAATEAYMAGVTAVGSRYKVYPELRHEVLNEPEGGQVRDEILAWWKELSA